MDKLKVDLSTLQKQVQECESRRKLGSKAEEELQRLQEHIQRLEKEDVKHKQLQEQLDEVRLLAFPARISRWLTRGYGMARRRRMRSVGEGCGATSHAIAINGRFVALTLSVAGT